MLFSQPSCQHSFDSFQDDFGPLNQYNCDPSMFSETTFLNSNPSFFYSDPSKRLRWDRTNNFCNVIVCWKVFCRVSNGQCRNVKTQQRTKGSNAQLLLNLQLLKLHLSKSICSHCKMYFSQFQNVFLHNVQYICPNYKGSAYLHIVYVQISA